MGWETGAAAGFSILSASNKIDQGKAQAQALADQGTYQEKNIADNTVRTAGKLQTSFLQGGIALDDVGGTSAVLSQAFTQGTTDINRTQTNADNASKNAITAARSAALETLAQGLGASGLGSSIGGAADSATSGLYDGSLLQDGVNGFGQSSGSYLDPSPTGPYLPGWKF